MALSILKLLWGNRRNPPESRGEPERKFMMLITGNRVQSWMLALGQHYQRMRRRYPEETLLIAFDIGGTVVDPRVLLESQRAYPQAMDVIAHFAAWPGTAVVFSTGRAEELRELTLDTLNRLGARSGVTFSDSLLRMNCRGSSAVRHAKREALDEYRRAGYRVIAMADNEPDNLDALADYDEDLLLLCAKTSSGGFPPAPGISGHRWCVRSLRFGLLTGAAVANSPSGNDLYDRWRDLGRLSAYVPGRRTCTVPDAGCPV